MAKIRKMSASKKQEFIEAAKKASYVQRNWTTAEEDCISLEEYAKEVDPALQYADTSKNAVIVAKTRKDGNIFYKMSVPLTTGTDVEFDLSYKAEFDEDDEIDLSTWKFCLERSLGKTHGYATGEVIE